MKIGFTGTRNGMTRLQRAFVLRAVGQCHVTEVHHGACIGADYDFHTIAMLLKLPIVIHPGVNKQGVCYARANCPNAKEVKPEKFYLDRDKDIVNAVDLLIATPKSRVEELRSGTWATVRYARKKDKDLLIVFPDGNYGVR
jgi:hypothetical protein